MRGVGVAEVRDAGPNTGQLRRCLTVLEDEAAALEQVRATVREALEGVGGPRARAGTGPPWWRAGEWTAYAGAQSCQSSLSGKIGSVGYPNSTTPET